jgi:hypothetical protein
MPATECEPKFKYVCKYKQKLDNLQTVITDFSNNFTSKYVAHEKAANNSISTARPDLPVDPNYVIFKSILAQMEGIKNEVTKQIHDNTKVMENIDQGINKNKRTLGVVSASMDSLSDRAEGSYQSYKNEVGMYRRDIFSNFAFLGLGSMVCYLSYNIYSENANN